MSTFIEEMQRKAREYYRLNGEEHSIDSLIADVVGKVAERVEGMRRKTLEHADIQLLSRHEREEYNEEVVGYNKALDDIRDLLAHKNDV